MKKIFTILSITAGVFMMNAQTVLTQWNFDASSTTASTGTGTISLIGGTAENIQTGTTACNCPYVNGNPSTGKAYTTKTYPAQGTLSGTAGIQFTTSTVGLNTIAMSVDVYGSNTASKYVQVQYSTDGTNWTNATAEPTALAPSTWSTVSANLPASANNNPNVSFRVVSVFAPTTSNYAAIGATSNYAVTGALRYDNATFYNNTVLAVGDVTSAKNKLVLNTSVNNTITFGAKANVQIINANGQVLKSASVNNGETVDVSSLPKGMYIVTGNVNGETVSQKIIKQ